MSKKFRRIKYADIRAWVKTAVAQEDAKPLDPIWKGEPSEGASIFRSTKIGTENTRFWSPHPYLITTTTNKKPLKTELGKQFLRAGLIPRPIKAHHFETRAGRSPAPSKTQFFRSIGCN
jgi:hypothetical protein